MEKHIKGYWLGDSVGGYKVGDLVGQGRTGAVHLVDGSNDALVIKIMKLSNYSDLQEEKRIHDVLQDTLGVPKIHAIGQSRRLCWMVMDNVETTVHTLCLQADAFEFSAKRRSGMAALVVSGALCCLKEVHSKGVIHGDLHPGNITFSLRDEDFHLIDFGSAVVLGEPVKGVNYIFGSYRLTLPDYTPSPADDILSLAYLLVWMVKRYLPWALALRMVGNRKRKPIDLDELEDIIRWKQVPPLTNLPPVFQDFISYALALPPSTPFDQIKYDHYCEALAQFSIIQFTQLSRQL